MSFLSKFYSSQAGYSQIHKQNIILKEFIVKATIKIFFSISNISYHRSKWG